ncbi:MAG TPA: phosphatase PAP2 family protein [Dermatophilaceae bacterium]|nr:phosphatase PAP2 family protein [Dermatophilaceae bacterium]
MNQLRRLDDQLLLAVNDLARDTPWLHSAVLAFAKYGLVVFAALLLAGLVAARHGRSRHLAATGWAAVATILALALNQPLGRLVAERRPYAVHPGLLRLADVTTDFSFPSDHAVVAGAVAAGLLLAHRRLGAVALVAGLLMAFSRVYIAAHYPWDVVGGMIFGAVVAVGGWLVLRTPLTWLTRRLRGLPGPRAVFAAPGTPGPRRTPQPGRP